jgi:predicted ester cyclase
MEDCGMAIRLIILISAISFAIVGTSAAGVLEKNKAVIEGFVTVGNNRDYDKLGDFVSKDFVRHCQATPGLIVNNQEQFIAFMEADVQVCPDSKVEVHQMVAEGDRVAIWATYFGTQEGAMGPFPPSGKKMVQRLTDTTMPELKHDE